MSGDEDMDKFSSSDLPEAADKAKKGSRGSLLERASDAFGLDKLSPPPPPRVEGEPERKFARPRKPAPDFVVSAATETQRPPAVAQAPAPAIGFRGPRQEIVRSLLREQGMIDPDGGASALLEEFRIIKRQLLASAKSDQSGFSRRVLVCSPHPNEGKTFCALNLALAMAGERDTEVVLVDADFAKPSIMTRLGLSSGRGLMDVLADDKAFVEDHVVATDIAGLFVLPAGMRTGRDSEYLASARTHDVLERLTRGAPNRFIIFDSPPALAASPAAELAKLVGQALLVARADMTGKAALEDALDLLSACPDIKLLLNDATFSPSGRKFGSYYGYGE